MDVVQTNITLGTAGHIDHGKTALIKCLTGCETDRLKAEKERGMSIDLGFAPCRINGVPFCDTSHKEITSDVEIGIVDVPGHENFIKTMVAGASGIDGVIFVIAADDGVMPQTREHLDILTLLGVRHGIVALTKADCVGSQRLQTVSLEIESFLEGTFLENAPVLPVSSITGQGFDTFYEALKKLVSTIKPKKTDGVFRMPVERTFSLKGYGTVVTGIPVSGSVSTGGEVVLLPQALKGRVKAIQVYKRDSDTAMSGQCVAFNIPQWDHKTIRRGDVVTIGEYFSPEIWYLCKLRVLDSNKLRLKNGARVKLHTGTSEVLSIMYVMEGDSIAAGQECFVQFRLSEAVAAGPRDHFILRSLSPVQTVGGGMIIEATPKKLKRSHPEILQDTKTRAKAVLIQKDFVEYCVKTADSLAANETELSLRTKVPLDSLKEILTQLTHEGKVLNLASKLYIHSDISTCVQQRLVKIVSAFHSNRPESPGIDIKEFYKASGLPKGVFNGIVTRLISEGKLVERKHRLALPEHCEIFGEDERRLLEIIESLFSDQLFNPPKSEEIMQHTTASTPEVQKALRVLVEQERLVQVENNLFFHHKAIEQGREILTAFIKKEGELESVKFKYLLDTTRKFAIPLLDYFDRIGVTRRVGNTRYLKKPAGAK
ncbi:MAG: selenocysteine-specific translation elongation factor [Planctomycetota bacterium]|jgi:selenocysteine-specific elongation factor